MGRAAVPQKAAASSGGLGGGSPDFSSGGECDYGPTQLVPTRLRCLTDPLGGARPETGRILMWITFLSDVLPG